MNKNSLLLLPATKSQGYASYFDGEKTELFTVEINDGKSFYKLENSNEVMDFEKLDLQNVVTLKSWIKLEEASSFKETNRSS